MSLADQFRETAAAHRTAANDLIATGNLIKLAFDEQGMLDGLDAKNLAVAIIGQVNATILETAADQMDYLRVATGEDAAAIRRRGVLQRNDAIRRAAAAGNWAEFDRLAAGGEPSGVESTGGAGA